MQFYQRMMQMSIYEKIINLVCFLLILLPFTGYFNVQIFLSNAFSSYYMSLFILSIVGVVYGYYKKMIKGITLTIIILTLFFILFHNKSSNRLFLVNNTLSSSKPLESKQILRFKEMNNEMNEFGNTLEENYIREHIPEISIPVKSLHELKYLKPNFMTAL